MTSRGWCLAIAVAVLGVSAVGRQQPAQTPAASTAQGAAPLHIYIRSGLKSHGPGQHDYPQFLADWSKVLTERGAIVDGSLHFPTAAELATTDVMVMYKGDAGYMTPEEKATLEAYLKRGGGIVSFHDTLCGPDPDVLLDDRRRREEARRGQLHARGRHPVHDRRHSRTRSCRACRTSRSRTRRSS